MRASHVKARWGGSLLVLGLLAAVACLFLRRGAPQGPGDQPPVIAPAASAPAAPSQNPLSNLLAQARNFGVRKAVLTPEERAALAKKFTAEIKPAVDRWCKAFAGHVPFKPEHLTLDQFKEQIGRNASFTLYTFVVDGITLCVRDSKGHVVLNYLNAPETRHLMAIPGGAPPTMELPVSRSEVIRMVKEESGTEFKAKDVELRPTGTASAMNGGAFVDIAHLGGDPNNGLCKVSLVFGPEGRVVYYDRDPTF